MSSDSNRHVTALITTCGRQRWLKLR